MFISEIFVVKLIFEMLTVCGQQHSFSTHEQMFLWKCQCFWERKYLNLRGTQTPNLRIHAEYSNHLSRARHLLSHAFKYWLWQYKYFENANYDVGHTYGINWKWNNWDKFHFYFYYHLMYFQLKTNSVGITEVSVVPMANNMYFIQWIMTSYYQHGYKSYRNNSVSIKIACA